MLSDAMYCKMPVACIRRIFAVIGLITFNTIPSIKAKNKQGMMTWLYNVIVQARI